MNLFALTYNKIRCTLLAHARFLEMLFYYLIRRNVDVFGGYLATSLQMKNDAVLYPYL